MSTLRTINVIHPSGSTTNIVNDNAGNVAIGGTLNASTITSPVSTALTIQSAGTTAMTVNTSQNVGIGITSPTTKLDVLGTILVRAAVSSGTAMLLSADTTNANGTSISSTFVTGGYGPLKFLTANTEAMRIDTSGNVFINSTSQPNGTYTAKLVVNAESNYATTYYSSTIPSSYTPVVFLGTGNALAGYINVTGTTTSFVSASDYRIKEDITPLASGILTVSALKPVSYKWKSDQSVGEGFIAHELGDVIPLALFGEKDALNGDGSIKPQGIDMTKIIPHLVAAIQELSAKNDALEAANAAFEARLAALESKQ